MSFKTSKYSGAARIAKAWPKYKLHRKQAFGSKEHALSFPSQVSNFIISTSHGAVAVQSRLNFGNFLKLEKIWQVKTLETFVTASDLSIDVFDLVSSNVVYNFIIHKNQSNSPRNFQSKFQASA
ncbi:unnamed protein product [Albugo candida]|uniref:Uncharacterized protein n=1 Tax=Albugo candida TaxID=65357 RepID=A0A024FU64_9STRA|nr:unnamed protein product [Albugo candida]|eukprot:CCI10204.1 unnamed protein product [Albugo candida]